MAYSPAKRKTAGGAGAFGANFSLGTVGDRLQFRILGPLEVWRDGVPVRIGGPRQRALLALLLCNANRVVSRDRLVDELMGDHPAGAAEGTLHVQVSRLRKALRADRDEPRLLARPPGYLLRVEEGELDLDEFERRLAAGRRARELGELERAAAKLREAESMWRGRPLADLEFEPFARLEVQRLEELRLLAVEDRIEAELALGRHAALVPELETLVEEHPLRERLRGQLMLALYRTGRQADALAAYRAGRSLLVQELALEPSPQLRQLEQAILTQDRSLQLHRSGDAVVSNRPVSGDGGPRVQAQSDPAREPTRPTRRPYRRALIAASGVILVAAAVAAAAGLTRWSTRRVSVPPNSLAGIDVRSDRVVAVVPVGSLPGPVAFGSGSLWVANAGDQTVSQVDPVALRTLRTLTLGAAPTGIAASSDAIWVVESRLGASSVAVRRIDPQFDALEPPQSLGNVVPGGPGSVAAQGNAVWVAPSSGLLAQLDGSSGGILQQLDPNASPAGIALGNGAVWVTDSDANSVTRVDPTGLLTPVAAGNGPSAIATGAGGVWVTDTLDDTVVRIDPATAAVTTTIPVGRSPSAIAVGDGSVWVADAGDGTVTRIDPSTAKVAAKIPVGGSPRAITVAGARAWVTVGPPPVTRGVAPSGGSLRMETLSDVDFLDPALAYAPGSWQVLYATCAKLLNYPDRSGPAGAQLTPEIASSLPALGPDGRTYAFTLRTGFRFSPPSNQVVTAQTFKATIERTLNPRMNSPVAHEFANVVGAAAYMAGKTGHISGIQVRGDKLTVRLLTPEPDFASRLAQPFFCAVPTDTPVDPNGIAVVPSAGPYYVSSYTPGRSVVLVRNPNYHGNRPHRLDRIVLTLGISSQEAVADIQAGRADYTTIGGTPASTVAALAARLAAQYGPSSPAAAQHRQQYFQYQLPGLDFLILNTHRPLFSDPRMRQAVNYAVDRQSLARLGNGFGSADRPASQYLPPGIPGYSDSSIYPLTPDLARATSLASGHGRTAVLYACDYSACLQLAQLVRDELAGIGLRVEVKTFDHVTLYARIARPHAPFDLAFAGWIPDWPDPAAMLNGMLANGSFYPTFNDPNYKREFAAANQLTGPRRYLTFGKLALNLARSAPLVPYGDGVGEEFFSRRIGCQTYSFYYGADLAALCIRRPHT
jgi:YVTN family beta-propeller protein